MHPVSQSILNIIKETANYSLEQLRKDLFIFTTDKGLSIDEVIKISSRSRAHIGAAQKAGLIKPVKSSVRGKRRFMSSDICKWIDLGCPTKPQFTIAVSQATDEVIAFIDKAIKTNREGQSRKYPPNIKPDSKYIKNPS